MHTYLLTLSYKGTRYRGWQIQPQLDTVQGQLNRALGIIAKSSDIHSLASGRTDAGVHALALPVRIRLPLSIELDSLMRALNANLPEDIRVVGARHCASNFHPLGAYKRKEYRYFFAEGRINAHFRDSIVFVGGRLDVGKMKEGIGLFVGKYDFCNYCCRGTETTTTVREVFEASLREVRTDFPEMLNFFEASFCADGFLKQMVRLMVGALLQLGRGKIGIRLIEESLRAKMGQPIAPVAPPQGLFLHRART